MPAGQSSVSRSSESLPGVFRDAEHPLPHHAAFHGVTLPGPLLHLLVGQDGAEFRAPVDRHVREVGQPPAVPVPFVRAVVEAVREGQVADRARLPGRVVEPGIIELEEDPLGPPVIFRIGGVDLPRPVVGEAEHFDLSPERRDVLTGGDFGVDPGLHGVAFGGEAERVPPHRVEDVEPLHPLETGVDVGRGVPFRVPDMESRPGGVGIHVEDVELGLRRLLGDGEGAVRLPGVLPLRFYASEIVVHGPLLKAQRVSWKG